MEQRRIITTSEKKRMESCTDVPVRKEILMPGLVEYFKFYLLVVYVEKYYN